MRKVVNLPLLLLITITGLVGFIRSGNKKTTGSQSFIVDTLATGLTVPWAFTFLNDTTLLFTERNGKVRLMHNDHLSPKPALVIEDTDTTKKMGLLGLCRHPDFTTHNFIYVAYNYSKDRTAFLRVVRYTFAKDTLLSPFIILDSVYASPNHTGCRLKFGPDKKLYITTGDADRPILAQNLKSLNGKILRVNDNGSIPPENPFIHNDTARKEIWSYGHRNTQGIDFQPVTRELYNSEHGPNGGDEINFIQKGKNYGWPVIHHDEANDSMVRPLFQYTPSIGPSEIVFYDGSAFPQYKGKLLLASLKGEAIMQIALVNKKIVSQEYILQHRYGRIRALTVGPKGYLYFSTSQNDPPEGKPKPGYDMILRLRPSGTASGKQTRTENNNLSIYKSGKKSTRGIYSQLCAGCHGSRLEGTKRAKSMRDNKWENGGRKQDIIKSIRDGMMTKGMPAWQGALTDEQIEGLANFIVKAQPKKKRLK